MELRKACKGNSKAGGDARRTQEERSVGQFHPLHNKLGLSTSVFRFLLQLYQGDRPLIYDYDSLDYVLAHRLREPRPHTNNR